MRANFIAVFVLLSLPAFAQSDRGTITGTISDPSDAVVPNARVEARNTATGAIYQVASSGTGNYTLSQLPIGSYELTVTVTGFKQSVHPGITVEVAASVRIDPRLEIGVASEAITVNAQVSQLRTESGALSHNIPSDRLSALPAISVAGGRGLGNVRNPLQAVTLLPGTLFANENTLRINGMPSNSAAIRIEGQDASNGLHRQFNQVAQAGMDAIQEVSVQTSNYAAEYGQAGGGYFNYTMKSGGNQFHGGAYDYIANEFLNSPTPFTTSLEGNHEKNKQRRHDYGFTIGGPIAIPKVYNGRDKSFFFFNFEQFRESLVVSTNVATVPTAAYRVGNFSGARLGQLTVPNPANPSGPRIPAVDSLGNAVFQNAVYDPKTTQLASDGSTARTAYPGNIVPSTDLDKVAQNIQAYMPLPRGDLAGQAINNYAVPAFDNFRHITIPSFKLDHNVSAAIKVSAYYSENRQVSPSTNGFPAELGSVLPQAPVSRTTRLNYDHTITPVMLLHLGAGLMMLDFPAVAAEFDQSTLGWAKNFYANQFPGIMNANNPQLGGSTVPLGAGFSVYNKEIKPTANASLTWVRGNHTVKMGGEMILEGLPARTVGNGNGRFGFTPAQSGNPWENGRGTNALTGFAYASFLLGRANSLALSRVADLRLGNHAFGFYAQDAWKVTRKLTLDYGLRYDYVSLLKEQYGRVPSAAFGLPNAAAANRLGNVIYEATCGCSFNKNYKFAFGPRLGAAYQIDAKTVLRGGVGVVYGSSPNSAFLSNNAVDFYAFAAPGYGEPASLLVDGNPYAAGNRFGNPEIQWPDYSPHYPNLQAPGIRPPQGAPGTIGPNDGRPPRSVQWSIGLQREVLRNLVVEVSYVGNRGAYWTGPALALETYNALTPEGLLQNHGIDVSKPADRTLLTTPISSPNVTARFPFFQNRNNVYPGFPADQTLGQALRPYPHWLSIPSGLGPPLGRTWYDSLQATVTKRYSHGLDLNAAFTWQKELINGVGADTPYATPNPPLINDVFNRGQQKQLSGMGRPLMFVLSFNYTTPGFSGQSAGMQALSWAVRDWSIGGVLRYQSGAVIRTPGSNNGLFAQLRRQDNPPFHPPNGNTFWNAVPGQNPLLFDPNCKCFDPTTQTVLNTAAWTDAAPGQFGVSAPFYNGFRWQRQPQESASIGRIFRIHAERGVTLQVRAEFFNVFNRTFLSMPVPMNPQLPTTRNNFGAITGGYGFVNTVAGAGTTPRSGQIVARLSF